MNTSEGTRTLTPPRTILDKIASFRLHYDSYRQPSYKEAQVRQEFIDPLFKALGWDIDNDRGYAEHYKEVIHEDALKAGRATKAPDYCFRLGGERLFFVEAKKPSISIDSDSTSAAQLRRYAWQAQLPLSLLTNFEYTAVYDCRNMPKTNDQAATARFLIIKYDELADRWNELATLVGRESVLKGSLTRFALTKPTRGSVPVDAAFLRQIEAWRKALARGFAERNELTSDELNAAVQRTLDRIIFLRLCEDRGLELPERLKRLPRKNIYRALFGLFEKADEKYNSGLFYFNAERNRAEQPDGLTPRLALDDRVLDHILRDLYEADYNFGEIPTEILGQAYELFLGKIINLKGNKAEVQFKPEVAKAGGVYYTPSYIVKEIVRRTLAPALRRATVKQAGRLRIVDPACGSGSFLIGAYQYLLDWHRDEYLRRSIKARSKVMYQSATGEWRLVTEERHRILRNNIFGVDIDPQAVEVTKLSLHLKVLEGESEESLEKQLNLFNRRALPDLGENVKTGNSLVDWKGIEESGISDVDAERIRPFTWPSEFPRAYTGGGFDIVIGNPPYAYRKATEETLKPYYRRTFECAEGNLDLYKFFIERALTTMLAPGGTLGFIVSASFLVQPTFESLRRLLLDTSLKVLAPLGPGVFDRATVDTAVFVATKRKAAATHRVEVQAPTSPRLLAVTKSYMIHQRRFAANASLVFDYRLTDDAAKVVARLMRKFPPIESGFEFGVGINTGYIREALVSDARMDHRYHRMLPGDGISRYGPVRTQGWIMYDPEYVSAQGDRGRTLPPERFFTSQKIVVVRTRNLSLPVRVVATLDRTGAYNLNRLSNVIARPGYDLVSLLGVLNSRLFNWLFATRFFDYEIKPVYLRTSPLAFGKGHSPLLNDVERMLRLHAELDESRGDAARVLILREVEALEQRMNRRVYELYGISSREVRLIT